MRQIGILAAALGAVGVCLAPVAWVRLSVDGLLGLAVAWLACFLPGLVLAVLGSRPGWFAGSERALKLLLVGTALRVGFVLAASLVLVMQVPALRTPDYFLGLSLLYLVALAVETQQLLATIRPAAPTTRGQAQ